MGHINPKYNYVSVGGFKVNDIARQYIDEILDSGIISYGKFSRQYEKDFSGMHGCKYGVLSNSGTSSLHVALQTLKEIYGWKDGDEVIVPATTFVATINIVLHNNMVPVLVDVNSDTYNINPLLIEEKITDKTRCIIPVHLFGQPANMSVIKEIADTNNLKIIEDSCECMFAKHKGKTVGQWSDIACFSMYVAHIIVAGVGGICITSNVEYAAKIRSLVNHGMEIKNLNVDDNVSPMPQTGRRFKFDAIGHSFRITEFEAALALSQLDSLHMRISSGSRARNAMHLITGLNSINQRDHTDIQLPVTKDYNTHAWMMFPIMWDGQKDEVIKYLNDRGIETRDMLPVLDQPIYNFTGDYPVSEKIITNGFYVGCHQGLTPGHIQYTIDTLREYVEATRA